MITASALRVMIVDDKGMMRSLLARYLERFGFTQIFFAANPREALPLAREKRVHMIISDYNMPGMNGLEFLTAVRSDPLLSKIVFIIVTGSGDCDVVRHAEVLGANAYIMKPVSQQQLHDKITELFGWLTGERTRPSRPTTGPREFLPL